jgi:hypothetical protein
VDGLLDLREFQLASRRVDPHHGGLAELSLQHPHRKRIQHPALNGPLQGSGTVGRVVSFGDQEILRTVRELDANLAVLEALHQAAQLDVDNLPHLSARQRVEDDDVVDPVQELRTEVGPQGVHHLAPDVIAKTCRQAVLTACLFGDVVAAHVRRHDHHAVLEVDRPPLAVCQPAVVQQLQHDVQHFGVCLLDLVEQDDSVGPPPHGLGELSGLLVAHVAGRRTDQPRYGVLLLIFGHINSNHRVLVVEQELGERTCQLGLADAGRPQEDEAAERTVGILEAGARAANRVGDRRDRFVLTDDPGVEPLFHAQELLDLSLHQAADRDVRPSAHDFGDVFLVHFLLQHPAGLLHLGETCFLLLQPTLELRQLPVLELGGLRIVSRLLRMLHLEPDLLELLPDRARRLDGFLLLVPVRGEAILLLFQIRKLLFQLLEPFHRRLVRFFSQRLALDLELHDAPFDFVELRGHGVDLHAQPRRRFVDEVNRLVGQEAVGDVAV